MKAFWQSKTFWANLIPLAVSVNDIVINALNSKPNSTSMIIVAVLSGLNIFLRFISKDKVTISGR